ncbi:MAG TPA: tetratricopeptide repeat protein [Candidatus Obscuribacterales bacterium]
MKTWALTLAVLAGSSSGLWMSANAQTEQQLLTELKRTEHQFGKNDTRTAEFAFSVGNFYHRQQQNEKAQPMFARAMSVFEAHQGNHADLLRYYSDQLARIDMEEGKKGESEKLFKQAIALGDRLPGKEKTYAVPNTLAGLAALYESECRYPEAEAALKQRLEMRHRFMNAGQVDLALVDLAELYTRWQKYDQAQHVFDELLHISPMPVQVRQAYSAFLSKTSSKSQPVAN